MFNSHKLKVTDKPKVTIKFPCQQRKTFSFVINTIENNVGFGTFLDKYVNGDRYQ